ncbi:MAG: hypothetical protein AAGF28_05260 [Pseudomonadota bacterium]
MPLSLAKTLKAFTLISVVASGFAMTSTTGASAQELGGITGVGFHQSQGGARAMSLRAWTNEARRMYGYGAGNYNEAYDRYTNCDYLGNGGGYSSNSVGVEGDANAAWTCTSYGVPTYANNGNTNRYENRGPRQNRNRNRNRNRG